MKAFVIYLASGELRSIEAPSLRTAVRNAEKEAGKVAIVAAIEQSCLPQPVEDDQPFTAVFLKNPGFVPPPET